MEDGDMYLNKVKRLVKATFMANKNRLEIGRLSGKILQVVFSYFGYVDLLHVNH